MKAAEHIMMNSGPGNNARNAFFSKSGVPAMVSSGEMARPNPFFKKTEAVQMQTETENSDVLKEPGLSWDPETVLNRYLSELINSENAKDEEGSGQDQGAVDAWHGAGPQGKRKQLLLFAESNKLSTNLQYRGEQKDLYNAEENPEEAYLKAVKEDFDSISKGEQTALEFINHQLGLTTTSETFIDASFYKSENAANAFPNFSWAIVKPLITPPANLVSKVLTDFEMSNKYFQNYWALLAADMFENGLPLSYGESLGLGYFRMVRTNEIMFVSKIPNQAWLIQNFMVPHNKELFSAVMSHCESSFAYFGVSHLKNEILSTWSAATSNRWFAYNTKAISDFRKVYPSGFNYLDVFYNFEYEGISKSIMEIALAILLQTPLGGESPYHLLGLSSSVARGKSPQNLNALVQNTNSDFEMHLSTAGTSIEQLSPNEKLLKSIAWSIKKGYSGESINILMNKMDKILWDILKDWGTEKGLKKGVTMFVGYFGGPLGRLGTFLYNARKSYKDAKEFLEISALVKSLLDILDQARNSKSVIETQRSAARLAEATVSIIPMIIEILGSKFLDKLTDGVPKDKGDTLSDAKRNQLLEDSADTMDGSKLSADQLRAEVLTAAESKVTRYGKDKDYDASITLPNGHEYKRKNGVWCRASAECIPPSLNPDLVKILNERADMIDQNSKAEELYGENPIIYGNIPLRTGIPDNVRGRRSPFQTQRSGLRSRMKKSGLSPDWVNPDATTKVRGDGWNAHHVIPWEFRYHPAFDVLRSNGGWDHNDIGNGIALPVSDTIREANDLKLPTHQAHSRATRGHGVYNWKIEQRLTKLNDSLGHDPKALRVGVQNLIKELRLDLSSGTKNVLF